MVRNFFTKLNIFLGLFTKKNKIIRKKTFKGFKPSSLKDNSFNKNNDINSFEFIFTEFGEERVNAGGAILSQSNRLEPTLSGIKKYFPNAKITVYSDFDWDVEGVDVIKVDSPLSDRNHPRFGYRTSVYFRFLGMLASKSDFVCAIDSDMYIVNENIYSLVTLTRKFGFCVPDNDRQILNQDMRISLDTQIITDESYGNGHSYNQSPMTLWKNDKRGEAYYTACMNIMKNDPSRGSLVMWKASWKTGIYPYILPKQFCVCSGQEDCGDEIILHIGHPSVKKFYNL